MTIGLSNGSKRSKYGQTVNQNQGGGSKKAGFPYQVGRTMWTNVALQTNIVKGNCCKLSKINTNSLIFTLPHQSRPIGSSVTANRTYWRVAGP